MKSKQSKTTPLVKTLPTYQSEEDVKIHYALPLLESLGYKKECMSFEKTIAVHEGTKETSIYADIVVYSDKKRDTPLIVVDTKAPNEILDRSDREQVISYARLLPKIAPLAVLTNGSGFQVFQTLDKTRIKELPNRKDLLSDFVRAVVSAGIQEALRKEATRQLFVIDDVRVFKTLLSRCHNEIRNNDGYDPIKAFDELSKVLFAKMYEEKYRKDRSRFTLSTYRETTRLGVNIIQKIFQEIQEVPEFAELFNTGTRIELQDRTIESIVATFEKYDLTLTRFDVKGEAFEHFLGDTFTGGLGQYFTPRNVVEFVVDAISPKIGDKIIDPFCGTGGFLIYAFEAVSEKIRLNEFSESEAAGWRKKLSNECLFGTDWIERTAQACKMNMIVHGDGNTGVFKHDGFVDIPGITKDGLFDICFTNPPFGATETDPNILREYELGQGRRSQEREVLAIERCIRLVRPGGLIGMVMVDGVLNNDSYSYVRNYVNREAELLAVIGLNKETFQGYSAQAKTSLLLMRRKDTSAKSFNERRVFMAVCENSGYAPNGLGIAGNQLPDILFDLKKYRSNGDVDFIHKRTSILTLEDKSDRLDAEYYVAPIEDHSTAHPINVTLNLSSDLSNIQQLITRVQIALSGQAGVTEFNWVPLSEVIEPSRDLINPSASEQYNLLGLHGKAEGLFVKATEPGSSISGKKYNRITTGQFIYSRLFAKNGSFAVVDPEFDGGLVSNEFPTFSPKKTSYDSKDLLEYIVFYLSSPPVLSKILRANTGSTKESRGRFKESQLLKTIIPLPVNPSELKTIIESIRGIREYREAVQNLASSSVELPKSLQMQLPVNTNVR